MNSLRFDFGKIMAPALASGVEAAHFDGELADAFGEAHAAVEAQRSARVLGFLDLPYASETVDQVKTLAEGYGQWFEDVVVLGIGGSSLGAKALRDALLGPFWNDRSDEGRDHFPRERVAGDAQAHRVLPAGDEIPGRSAPDPSRSAARCRAHTLGRTVQTFIRSASRAAPQRPRRTPTPIFLRNQARQLRLHSPITPPHRPLPLPHPAPKISRRTLADHLVPRS